MRPGEIEKGIDLQDPSIQTNFCSKLTKAEFSGSYLTVINARN